MTHDDETTTPGADAPTEQPPAQDPTPEPGPTLVPDAPPAEAPASDPPAEAPPAAEVPPTNGKLPPGVFAITILYNPQNDGCQVQGTINDEGLAYAMLGKARRVLEQHWDAQARAKKLAIARPDDVRLPPDWRGRRG